MPTRQPFRVNPQSFLNGEIHNWYRIILGYPDHLVSQLLEEFQVKPGEFVLDPFCGTGTTLIECMKRQIHCVGIDANPSSVFAARVKTNWALRSSRLLQLLVEVRHQRLRFWRDKRSCKADITYRYLSDSGMIRRGWISREPLRKAIGLKRCIAGLRTTPAYRDALTLALLAEVRTGASNIKFGPELYCGPKKRNPDVFGGFAARIETMARDLEKVSGHPRGTATVLEGDAREVRSAIGAHPKRTFAGLICSPPYPAEHDYTRNSRLELAFLEFVTDLESLRLYKRRQIRSHTKGIYANDNDGDLVGSYRPIEEIAQRIDANVRRKTDGFARLYSTVITEYFGGMKRHLQSVASLLSPGAMCAYVVGDQSAYAGVHIPTAEILALIATECGIYDVVDIRPWRSRRATTTSRTIQENILLLRRL